MIARGSLYACTSTRGVPPSSRRAVEPSSRRAVEPSSRRAVEPARLPEKPIAQIAEDLGIAESGLRRWKEQAVKAHNLGRAVGQLAGLDLQ